MGRKTVKKQKTVEQDFENLPVYKEKARIIESVKTNQVVVIVGQTGSGKTTQIPKLLLPDAKRIIVTQPRRVAAIQIATRVASEMNSRVGELVGYSVRFKDCSSFHKTRIKYVTDGMLLRELLIDNMLTKYDIIVLDEVHERTLRTDILMGAIKSILKNRTSLKLVVMSATLNASQFSKYFDNCPILQVPGRLYPVTNYFSSEKQPDYMEASLASIIQIHKQKQKGDVLVFLTGQEDIENLEKMLNEQNKSLASNLDKILVCPIFAALPPAQQSKVFEKTPIGFRKVVLATNIAETSITISGIKFVIDCGLVKRRGFNPKTGIETLGVLPISKASANQRSGRAGRESEGYCYRLYTEESFKLMHPETEPEIKRLTIY